MMQKGSTEAQMGEYSPTVEKRVHLSSMHIQMLHQLTQRYAMNEAQVIAKALDILAGLADFLDMQAERWAWSALSQTALERVWDNEADAVYDNWEELYGV